MSKTYLASDGFLDFKIFIKLMIMELKLLMFPKIPSVKDIAKIRRNSHLKGGASPPSRNRKMNKARSMMPFKQSISNVSAAYL